MYLLYARAEWIDTAVLRGQGLPDRSGIRTALRVL